MGSLISCFKNEDELNSNLLNNTPLNISTHCYHCNRNFKNNEYNKHIIHCKKTDKRTGDL